MTEENFRTVQELLETKKALKQILTDNRVNQSIRTTLRGFEIKVRLNTLQEFAQKELEYVNRMLHSYGVKELT